MGRMKLRLDALAVESFSTGGDSETVGTVNAHSNDIQPTTEPTEDGYFTCAVSGPCYQTCADQTCYPGCALPASDVCATADVLVCGTGLCSAACFDQTFACPTTWC